MKLAREIAIVLLCSVGGGCTAAGSGVNLAILDVPVATALSDNDDVQVPADVDDGSMYEDDNIMDDAARDDGIDDVQVKYKTVDQHVHLVDSQPTDDASISEKANAGTPAVVPLVKPVDSTQGQPGESMPMQFQDGDLPKAHVMNNGMRDANLIKDSDDGEAALSDSDAPIQAPPTQPLVQSDDAPDPLPQPGQSMPMQFQDGDLPKAHVMNHGMRDANLIKAADDGEAALSDSDAPIQAPPTQPLVQSDDAPVPLPQPDAEPDFMESANKREDGSDSDGYAMMMYFKGRAASVEKENKRMKDMLAQATAWAKGKKQLVTDLNAERKETEVLKGQLRGFQAAKERIAKELLAERMRQKASESKVKALEYVHQQLVASQSDNADLQHQLDNVTHYDETLQVQLVASQHGVQAAERSKSAISQQQKSEQEWLEEEARKLANVKIVKQEEDTKLETSHEAQEAVKKFQHVVDQRDELLRKGLQQLLTEKEHEQDLRNQLEAVDSEFAGKLRGENANMALLRQELQASAVKVRELKRDVALTWRKVAQGNNARQQAARSMTQANAELKRVKAVDKEVQMQTQSLKRRIEAEKRALQNSTEKEQLADESRDAAQAELASASATIEKFNQQRASVAQEKRELKNSLALARREESQFLRDAMGSVSDSGGLNLANLSTPLAQNRTSAPIDEPEVSLADLPTLDVVAP